MKNQTTVENTPTVSPTGSTVSLVTSGEAVVTPVGEVKAVGVIEILPHFLKRGKSHVGDNN
jgi:hypothetical protein